MPSRVPLLLFVDVEWFLAGLGAVETDMEENPRKEGGTVRRVERGRSGGRDDEYDEDEY